MTFDYTIDEEIAIMTKYKLSPNELFVIKSILLLQEGYEENYLGKFLQIDEKDRGDFRSIILSLQDKGVILKSYKVPNKGENFNPLEIPVNKGFFTNICRSSFELGKELFENYPMFCTINGALVSIRGVSKKFNSLEDFFRFYGKTIRWNVEKHKQIIDLLKWEKEHDVHFINFSLCNFVVDQKWNELEELRNGNLGNFNYDTIKSL